MTGILLIVLLGALGVTILRIGQLIWEHLFIGLLLLGPVLLKIASTGDRFARYYTRERTYRVKGPPPPALRLIAPLVVIFTIIVFASGIVLLAVGPAHPDPYLLVHKASFIAWLAVTALHVLGHLPGLSTSFPGASRLRDDMGIPGTGSRWLAIGSAVVAGLVLAVILIPDFATWTAQSAVLHHDEAH